MQVLESMFRFLPRPSHPRWARDNGPMPTPQLPGRIVLITGANGGLGNAVTQAFLNTGARVVGVSRSIVQPDFPGENFTALPAEISTSADAQKIASGVLAQFQRIDALIHLIGGFSPGSIAETSEATLDRMLLLNFKTAFFMIAAVLPAMRQQGSGRIAAIGAKAALMASPKTAAYAASKAALVSLMKSLADGNPAIATKILLPTTIDTPANRASMPHADFSKWIPPTRLANTLVRFVAGEKRTMTAR